MLLAFTFGCMVICLVATLFLAFTLFDDLMQSIKDYRAKNIFAVSTLEMVLHTIFYIGFVISLCIGDYNMIMLFLEEIV